MDFIVLAVVNSICKYAATYLRITLSATFGALWSVIVILIPEEYKAITSIGTYICISMVMVKICAGKIRFSEVVKGVLVLYAVAFMLGGMMHFIYYYTYAGYIIRQVIVRDRELVIFIGISAVFLGLLYRQLVKIKVYSDKLCRICCIVEGREITIHGFVDTGNVLNDPIFHKPVCIAQKSCFYDILHEINDCTKVKYHVIPFRSLGCDNGILEVITAETMYIYYGKNKVLVKEALIGLTAQKLSSDGAYEFLVNSQLLKG